MEKKNILRGGALSLAEVSAVSGICGASGFAMVMGPRERVSKFAAARMVFDSGFILSERREINCNGKLLQEREFWIQVLDFSGPVLSGGRGWPLQQLRAQALGKRGVGPVPGIAATGSAAVTLMSALRL